MTKEEILDEVCPNRPWFSGGKTDQMILKVMDIYVDQQTANLYTFEEVQKIVGNVKKAVILFGQQINKEDLWNLDLNQFINK